ncbi:MAG TPA: metal ABC transporter permease [Syntrophorhabdales bacterium]|nr:metal ABC transporter permease [Syntrophorhabdales bacterium]
MEIFQLFQYAFIIRALIAGSFVALLCSVLGVLLVLRRLSLIGDGLAHVTFGSVAIGLLLKVEPIYISMPVVALSSLAILKLTEKARLYGDAAIGIVSAVGVSGGVMLAGIGSGFNVDLFSYLFGNILSVTVTEVAVSVGLSIIVLLVIGSRYSQILSLSFDEEFARTSGINARRINSLLAVLTAVTVVLTMKLVGIMLTSALLIIPAVTAFQAAKSFRGTMVAAAILAVLSVWAGIVISFLLNVPTGATIVLLNFAFFLILYAVKRAPAFLFRRR